MSWRRVSVGLALLLGPTILILMILRNWDAWAPWPFWVDDLASGLLLLAAGMYAFEDQAHLRGRLVGGAFGLAAAALWASLFEGLAGVRPEIEETLLISEITFVLTGAAFLLAAAGLGASLPSAHRSVLGAALGQGKAPKAKRPALRPGVPRDREGKGSLT